jgi:hypothetical protein
VIDDAFAELEWDSDDEKAVAGTDYKATVKVVASYGHRFDKTTKVIVNGKKVNASLNEDGKLIFTYVFASDNTYTGLKCVDGTWYYFVNGVVDESYSNLVNYNNSWYYVQKGVLNWNYTGLCAYGGSSWYVKKGKVDFSFSGTYAGKRIISGKVRKASERN